MKIGDYIKGFMGPISVEHPFGIVLWANRPPGPGFLMHSVLSEICTYRKPSIFVDDYLPMAVFGRSAIEQEELNREFFSAISGLYSSVHLMSAAMTSSEYLRGVIAMLERITFREFVKCLPEKKTVSGQTTIPVSECLHTSAELFAFEQARLVGTQAIIIPQFAQAIVALHRNISSDPLSAIVTASFTVKTDFEHESVALRQLSPDVLDAINESR